MISAEGWTQATAPESALDSLPSATIQFKPVGNALPISPQDAFIGYPFCSSNGTTFLHVVHHPDFAGQSIVGISPKGEVSTYRVEAAPGLVVKGVTSLDAVDSDLYALVVAAKLDTLREHGIDPASADQSYNRTFILRFSPNLSSPDVIPIDLKFRPMQIAVMGPDAITVLGFDRVNQVPVIAILDHTGQLVREIDPGNNYGVTAHSTAVQPTVPDNVRVDMAWSGASWVHYGNSLLLLVKEPNARVITLSSDGEVHVTRLHLAGLQALSLIPSDNRWFVRATEGPPEGNLMNNMALVTADPSDGAVLKIIRTPGLSLVNISCIHGGTYYAIQWRGEKDAMQPFLMVGSQ